MSKYTQKERDGLFELTDAARAELVDSKYYNVDLAPTSLTQRTWTTYNICSLWIGMGICLPSYALASSMVALGMSTWLAVLNVALGNALILIPMQLNSHAGTKYGIPYPVFARLSFGPNGAQIASIARCIVGCGWCGIQTWFGGYALYTILIVLFPAMAGSNIALGATFLIFWAMNIIPAYRGSEWIKYLEAWGAPLLGFLSVAIFIWAIVQAGNAGHGFFEIMNTKSNPEIVAAGGGMFLVFAGGLSANMAFWATLALNIPDFSRYAKSQRAQFMGQLYGMPTTMAAYAFIGAFVTNATPFIPATNGQMISDPTQVIALIGNPIAAILGAVGVIVATLTTNIAANIVAPSNGFSNLAPKRISYRSGVIITGIIAIAMQPWKLMDSANAYIFGWLGTYGILLGPLAGIYIADYYLVKKRNIDVMSLFQGEKGRYWYAGGFNPKAIIAWIVGCVPPLIGMFVDGLAPLYANGYVFAFVVAMLVYWVMMKSDTTSLVSEEEMEQLTER